MESSAQSDCQKLSGKNVISQGVFGLITKEKDSMNVVLLAPVSNFFEYEDPFATSILEIYLKDSLVYSSEIDAPGDWVSVRLEKKLPKNYNYRYLFSYCTLQYGIGSCEIKIQ